ncbi:Restriction endonuclease S subunit [Thermoplasmatales archaeon BRNA1]|nr:Restriction endonuclease S subunit [Thermoplasmatales archaeon BRNA1]
MPDKKNPRIRFKKRSKDWEEVRFSDLYKKAIQKNDLSYGNRDIISVAKMYYAPNPLITNSEYLKTYNIFLRGDIAFEGNRSKHFAYGRFVENTIGDGIVSHVFKVFRPIKDYDIQYWKYAINEEKVMRSRLAVSTKSSTMMKELRDQDFLNEKIMIPPVDEQRRIGQLLSTLDQLIEYYERAIPIFDRLVKSRFIEMFSDHEKVPLTELATINMGQSPESSTYNDQGIGMPFYQGKTEFTDTFVEVKTYCSDPKKVAKPMDILMSVRAPVGAVNLTSQECCIGRGLAAITPKNGLADVWFLFNALKTMEQQISDLGVGSTFKAINKEDMKKIKIPLAPLDLQTQFSSFVNQVDKSKFMFMTKLQNLRNIKESMIEALLMVQ